MSIHLQPRQHAALHEFNKQFCDHLPEGARDSGGYTAAKGDRFDEMKTIGVPDGVYRVRGSEWLHAFARGRFVSAMRATKDNEFGGPDVIEVAPPEPTRA